MTVAAELAKRWQRMEYILAIESVGWPTDENDLSSGFDGNVFVVDDLDGTLASDLGCTIHHGLSWSGTIGDQLDVISGQYRQGQLTFDLQDVDGWLASNFRPLLQGLKTSLGAAVAYTDTTIDIVDGTTLSEGDVIWIGGQEAVRLGAESSPGGGATRRYTGSTRAYLGTHRGMLRGHAQTSYGFAWPSDTTVYDWMRFWHNRNVDLFMHVPGEAVANCLRIWSGKLRGATREISGNTWTLAGVSDFVRDYERMWNAVDMQVEDQSFKFPAVASGTSDELNAGATTPQDFGHVLTLANTQRDRLTEKLKSKYLIAEGYRYRSEPGGTDGMRSTWDAGNVQAMTTSAGDANTIMRYMQVGKRVMLCRRAASTTHLDSIDRHVVELEGFSSVGHNDATTFDTQNRVHTELFEPGVTARWLLDNWHDNAETNRFAVNKVVSRNPVDVLLCFLTSRDYETWRGDTHGAAAGTATTPIFATTIGATNLYAGMALHCVEGDNKGEARVIVSNTTTAITVDEAFSNAPGTSEEYQVRNSIYDVLPLGWGLGIPYHRIDVAAFETLRDKYFSDAELGRFILGTQDKIDLLKTVREYICGPYGIHLTMDRSTGKLTPGYIGLAQGDGIVEDYTAVSEDEVLDVGPINYSIERPIARVWIKVRETEEKLVGIRLTGEVHYAGRRYHDRMEIEGDRQEVPSLIGGDTYDIPVAQGELLDFANNGVDEMTMQAIFNTTGADKTWLVNRANILAKFFSVPPPVVNITLDASHIPTVQAGTMLSITKSGVANPFATTYGWADVVGIVTRSTIANPLTRPALECTVMLLTDLNAGRIAPAAKLDGAQTGTDGTSDYFIVAPTTYTVETDDKDYYGFAVGDKLELFDSAGLVYSGTDPGPYTISGFGANNAQTPSGASTDIIRISESVDEAAIAAAVDATYYLTLARWSASNTARMEEYAAYADASGDLTGGDTARTYG